MAEKFDFGSSGWLDVLRGAYEEAVANGGDEARSTSFTMCEVYTDVPADLEPTGRIAWHCRLHEGVVAFKPFDEPAADVHLTLDYASVLPMGRLVVDGNAEKEAEMQRMAATAVRAGKFIVKGDLRKRPAFLAGVHDAVARMTA